jgi:hypothetical protein
MAIFGYLKTMPVPEIFQWVSQSSKTGTLRISIDEGEHTLAFDRGDLIFCASTRADRCLGRILIRQGLLTDEMHQVALKVRDESQIGVGKILTDLHIIRTDDLWAAVRAKVHDQILELYQAQDGAFRFNPEIPHLEVVPVKVDLTRAILEVTHRLDQTLANS